MQVLDTNEPTDDQLVDELDLVHRYIGRSQRHLLEMIAEVDRRRTWEDDGAHDMAHWLAMRYGISSWKAYRWIAAAHALPVLPCLSDAFSRGEIGMDKVVELTRFATPETEAHLIAWAETVSAGAIRHRGDLARRTAVHDVIQAERDRSASWWYFDEGRASVLKPTSRRPRAPLSPTPSSVSRRRCR
jgi:hypothetical protein